MKSKTSNLVLARARTLIPGVSQLLSKRPDQFSSPAWPSYFSRAKGSYVWDLDGHRFLDMTTSGVGANVLGYGDRFVNQAVKKAIRRGNSSSLLCPEDVELAEQLCEIHAWAGGVRYARTGGEAMAIAVRIARALTGRDRVLFSGYHGWHDWYMSANLVSPDALEGHHLMGLGAQGIPKALAGTSQPFKFGDLDDLAKKLGETDAACIVMEPVRGIVPTSEYLKAVRNLSRQHGVVLIFDEISSGFRHNLGGAHLTYGVNPDIAVFAKAMSNGFPMSAVIGSADVMAAVQSTFVSSTYWSEGVGPSAALATIKRFESEKVHERLSVLGKRVQDAWRDAAQESSISVTVSGLPALSYVEFEGPLKERVKSRYVDLEIGRRILASGRYYPNFAQTDRQIDLFTQSIFDSLSMVAREIADGSLQSFDLDGIDVDYGEGT